MVPNASPRGGHASAGVSFPSIFLQPRLSLSKGGLGGGGKKGEDGWGGCGAGRRDGCREGRDQRRRMEGGKRLAGPGRGWEKVACGDLFSVWREL